MSVDYDACKKCRGCFPREDDRAETVTKHLYSAVFWILTWSIALRHFPNRHAFMLGIACWATFSACELVLDKSEAKS